MYLAERGERGSSVTGRDTEAKRTFIDQVLEQLGHATRARR